MARDDPWAGFWLRTGCGLDGFLGEDPMAMIVGGQSDAEVAAHALYDQVREVVYKLNWDRRWWDWWQVSGVEALWLQTLLLGAGPQMGENEHRVTNRGRRQYKVRMCLDWVPDIAFDDYERQRQHAVAYLLEALTLAAESFKLGPLPELPLLPPPTKSDRNPPHAVGDRGR